MKKLSYFCVISFVFLFSMTVSAQDSCKVLMPALKGEYYGGCKKGLAHGQGVAQGIDRYKGAFKKGYPFGYGTYSWSTGEVYIGSWKKGKREGKGSFTFKIDGRDTTISGLWKNDIYAGPVTKSPKVTRVNNIDQYSFKKTLGIQDRVMINFQQNGSYNVQIENLMITATSGTRTSTGRLEGFDNISFPVTFVVRYTSYNKLKTVKYKAYIEFTIFEKGDWEVRLTN